MTTTAHPAPTASATPTLFGPQTPCPSWCKLDHAAEEQQERQHWQRKIERAPHLFLGDYRPDPDPLHMAETWCNMGDCDAYTWASVSLVRDHGVTRIGIGDDLEMTLDVAEELLRVLPDFIARGRAG
ncbi:MAG: hypothetical protein U0R78_19605 [Nocardioidaceae bacterium]